MTNHEEHLLKMLLGGAANSGEPCVACAFPTENDALAYAVRLAQLKPGDPVSVRRSAGVQRGIFLRPDPECGGMAVILFYDEDKELAVARAGYPTLSLPNEPFVLEDDNDA